MPTRSLHNIRKLLRWYGQELFLDGDGRHELMGSIAVSADGRLWEVKSGDYKLVAYIDELEARRGLERIAAQLAED